MASKEILNKDDKEFTEEEMEEMKARLRKIEEERRILEEKLGKSGKKYYVNKSGNVLTKSERREMFN